MRSTAWTKSAEQFSVLENDFSCKDLHYLSPDKDCLVLDVVCRAAYTGKCKVRLPIGIWFDRGSCLRGRGSDRTYNTGQIVWKSADIGKSIIAITVSSELAPFFYGTSLVLVICLRPRTRLLMQSFSQAERPERSSHKPRTRRPKTRFALGTREQTCLRRRS